MLDRRGATFEISLHIPWQWKRQLRRASTSRRTRTGPLSSLSNWQRMPN